MPDKNMLTLPRVAMGNRKQSNPQIIDMFEHPGFVFEALYEGMVLSQSA